MSETLLRHTNKPSECYIGFINSLVASCDLEHRMAAMGPAFGTLERAVRGRSRILNSIVELENISPKVLCAACYKEVQRQIERLRAGILEIENVWGMQI